MVPVDPLGAWLSVGRLVESAVVNGRLHPQIVPARLGLGGWMKAGGVEERDLIVVSSMVVTLAMSLVLASGL